MIMLPALIIFAMKIQTAALTWRIMLTVMMDYFVMEKKHATGFLGARQELRQQPADLHALPIHAMKPMTLSGEALMMPTARTDYSAMAMNTAALHTAAGQELQGAAMTESVVQQIAVMRTQIVVTIYQQIMMVILIIV